MIYRDDKNFPVNSTGDGGDSAVRAGILTMIKPASYSIELYEVEPGIWVRHPNQKPWNNPKNFTTDQTMMVLAGLKADDNKEAARRMYKARKGFILSFSQSIERDVVGSRKMPWPHSNWKDSNPDPGTYKQKFNWKKLKFEPVIESYADYEAEHKWFDYADPLFSNHLGAMIIVGKIWTQYWRLPMAYLFHFFTMYMHSKSKHFEENQKIAESYVFGTLKVFNWIKPRWVENNRKYWKDRNEEEYANLLEKFVSERV